MKRLMPILTILGLVMSMPLRADEDENDNDSDVYSRMESSDWSTRWDAAGEYLDSLNDPEWNRSDIYRDM